MTCVLHLSLLSLYPLFFLSHCIYLCNVNSCTGLYLIPKPAAFLVDMIFPLGDQSGIKFTHALLFLFIDKLKVVEEICEILTKI